jgi:hypothetical protein
MEPPSPSEKVRITTQLFAGRGKYSAFFSFYNDLSRLGRGFAVDLSQSLSREMTHRDILLAADFLKQNTHSTRSEAIEGFGKINDCTKPMAEKILTMALHVMIMTDSAAKDCHSADFSLGTYRPTSWFYNETLFSFVERSFPSVPEISSRDAEAALEDKAALKAWKLKRRLGVKFRRTNNLAEHLVFDPRTNFLYLFHHAAFLKAHLQRAYDEGRPLKSGMDESLKR